MAFDYVHHTNFDNTVVTDIVLTKPTGTTTNDILFALLKNGNGADPSATPSGWSLVASDVLTAGSKHFLYRLVAGGSEPANYTWTWAASTRLGGTMICYRDGFNTAGPIDVTSNTSYETSDTTCRAASMTVTNTGSPLIFFGCVADNLDTVTFGLPNNPSGATWTERVDTHDPSNSRFARVISDTIWASSGATSDMDSTMSHTKTAKHAFAVALVPSGRSSKNTRPAPLGVEVGMGWRM